MANAEKQSAAATDKTIYRTGRLVGSVLCKSNRTVVPKVCNTGLYAKGRGIGWPSAVLRESMKKQSEWKNDRKRVAMVLQKTHGGQDLTTAEYNIVMAYWRGQKSQKELFDRVFERVVG